MDIRDTPVRIVDFTGAHDAMRWLQRSLTSYGQRDNPMLADLTALDQKSRELVNQILGEGEVSINYDGAFRARTQEAVLAGVWRTLYVDSQERVLYDILEVADIPHTVSIPDGRDRSIDTSDHGCPGDVMNAMPILVELQSHCAGFVESSNAHVINLTLLPLSDADLQFLDERLGRGPIDTLSRAYGKCQVISTLVPNVWWVRFYNSMGVLILNTLEVTGVPEVLRAAPEDLQDSSTRLAGILAPYWSDVA